jgi:IS30 family transposase
VARFSEAEKALIWDWWQQGGSMRGVARELGRSSSSVRTMIESGGGVRPVPRCRNVRHLSLEEREEISRGMASGES